MEEIYMRNKGILSVLLSLLMVAVCCISVLAADEIWGRSGSDTTKGDYGKQTLNVSTTLTAHIPWNPIGQYVQSKGSSKGTVTIMKSGYTYKVYKGCHTIKATVTGVLPSFSATTAATGVTMSVKGGTETITANTLSVSYTIKASCTSLVGYKEYHSCQVDVYNNSGKAVETIQCATEISLY